MLGLYTTADTAGSWLESISTRKRRMRKHFLVWWIPITVALALLFAKFVLTSPNDESKGNSKTSTGDDAPWPAKSKSLHAEAHKHKQQQEQHKSHLSDANVETPHVGGPLEEGPPTDIQSAVLGGENETDFDASKCIIFAAEEGDRDRCRCPEGFILCSWMDLRQTQKLMEAAKQEATKNFDETSPLHNTLQEAQKSNSDVAAIQDLKHKIETERSTQAEAKASMQAPPWLRALCEVGDYGFKDYGVYVDYEVHVHCAAKPTEGNLGFEFRFERGAFIAPARLAEIRKVEETASPRSCLDADFFLCKPAGTRKKINCQMTEWSEWKTPCLDGVQHRARTIVRSGQNGGQPCIWKGEQPRLEEITEERPCPSDLVAHQITTERKDKGTEEQQQVILREGREAIEAAVKEKEQLKGLEDTKSTQASQHTV